METPKKKTTSKKLPVTKEKKTPKVEEKKKHRPYVKGEVINSHYPGRPSDIKVKGDLVIEYIKAGNPYGTACGCASLSYQTFAQWMRKGREAAENEDEDSIYLDFMNRVIQAEKKFESVILQHWVDNVPGNWQAAKELLSRRNSEDWGNKEKIDMVSNGETIGVAVFLPMKE